MRLDPVKGSALDIRGRTLARFAQCLLARCARRGLAGICVAALLSSTGTAAAADTRLIDAVQRQDRPAVRDLLRQKVDVNTSRPDGATALHWAAHRDDSEVASLLIKAGAKVDTTNEYGVTPLSLAATNGSAAMIGLLLTAGANANLALPTGETPLMTAARTGSVAAVTRLLDGGANVNASESERGQTALMWALSERHLPVVELLIARGADVHAGTKGASIAGSILAPGNTEVGGFTPLMFAARNNDLAAVKLLLAKGARMTDITKDGLTVLMVAVLRGHATLAEFLLDQGADPNVDKAGYTALHWAAGKWESSMTHDYPTTEVSEWRYLGGVPEGRLELVKALLTHGAKVDAKIAKRGPPRYGVNLFNSVRLEGATPLWLAALSADPKVMRLLIAAGADPFVMNADKVTALMVAAGLGRVPGDSLISDEDSREAAKVMIEAGNDLNAQNTSGDTALHGTAYYGNEQTAAFLVEKGADMKLKNKKGETPLKVADGYQANAMVLQRPKVAAVLRKLGATLE